RSLAAILEEHVSRICGKSMQRGHAHRQHPQSVRRTGIGTVPHKATIRARSFRVFCDREGKHTTPMAPPWFFPLVSLKSCAMLATLLASCATVASQKIMFASIADFELDKSALQYTGAGLQRPECILAEPDGSLWAADARGGVVHLYPDGRQQIVSQRLSGHFSGVHSEAARYLEGTLPNGLAFADNGDILIANFGTDRL